MKQQVILCRPAENPVPARYSRQSEHWWHFTNHRIISEDRNVVEKFALKVPVSRFLVNTPAALGGIGAATNLFPALTLGCGAVGGSSSSNNIGPMDLVNIRRVAWGMEKQNTQVKVDSDLVELLAAKILERLK